MDKNTRLHRFELNLITSDNLQGSRKSYVKIKNNVKKNVLTGYKKGHSQYLHCLQKHAPTLDRYSSKLYGSIFMTFGRNI